MDKYPEYKASGVEWLGEIPIEWTNWKVSRLFSKIGSGTTPKAGTPEYYENGTIPWVNTGDLNDGYLFDCHNYITEAALRDHSTLKIYGIDTLLIAMYGATIGKVAITKFNACSNQACCALSKSRLIDIKFAFYWFIAHKEHIVNLSYGGGQPNISQDIVRNIRISICSMSEQHAIVNFLDYKTGQIDRFIANRQKQIELLREQKAALINKAITKGINPNAKMKDSGFEWIGEIPEHWEVWKTKFLCKKVATGNTPSSNELKYYENGTINWFTPGDFKDEFQMRNSQRKVTEIAIEEKECKLFSPNSTYVIGIGATLGKVRISESVASANQQINVLEFNQKVLPEYGFFYFYSIEKTIIANANLSTMGIINQTIMKNLEMTLPPKEEQFIILNYIHKENSTIDTLISKYQKQIELMQEYRTSLISQAVTGKIDVRDWEAITKEKSI